MKELIYTILELEEWNKGVECSFCPGLNEAVCQIRTRSKVTEKIIANDEACRDCKEKFENDELLKCKDCGRLQTETYKSIHTGKHVCRCIKHKEKVDEKELPVLPPERRQTAFYERQINALQEEKTHLATEAQTHLDAMEAFEVWNKEHRQQLLDRIKDLETEVERLRKLTSQELVDKLNDKEKEISELKTQLEKLISQQTTQIEVKETKKWPWRLKK